jgi:hypothetical protein
MLKEENRTKYVSADRLEKTTNGGKVMKPEIKGKGFKTN